MRPRLVPLRITKVLPSKEAGFTLIEMIVTLLVLSIVLVLTLTLFDTNTRLAQVQTSVSDLQQNLRSAQQVIVRDLRAAGRGALPQTQFPGTVGGNPIEAISVINNVPASTFIDPGNSIPVLEGTDILVVRGALNQPVWMVAKDTGGFTRDTGSGNGSLTVSNTSLPGFNIPQSLTALTDAINANRQERIVLVSEVGDEFTQVVTLDPGSSAIFADSVLLAFTSPAGTWGEQFRGGAFSYVSMVEEYRYFIEDRRAVAGDGGSSLRPRLARAHVLAGSNTPYAGVAANWNREVADEIADLQVALGIDTNGDGALLDTQNETDEWLFNHAADDASVAGGWNGNPLFYVRLSTLALAERPDRRFRAPTFAALEDHAYTTGTGDLLNGTDRRLYRRRWMQTNVDLRNLF